MTRKGTQLRADPPRVARIWGELDDERDLEDVLAEEPLPAEGLIVIRVS